MSIQSQARATLAAKMTAHPEFVKAVISNGQTANGWSNTARQETGLELGGVRGNTTGTVWIDASLMTTPTRNATISIAGDSCMVIDANLDPAGALLRIDYIVTNPVTEGTI